MITDAFIYGGVDFLWKFINFALFPVLAHLLTVEEFGTYTLLNVVTWLIVMVINSGLHISLEKFYLATHDKDQKQEIISTSLMWLASFGILVVASVVSLSYFLKSFFLFVDWFSFSISVVTAFPMSLFHYFCNISRVDFSPWKFSSLHFLQNLLALGIGLCLVIFYNAGVKGLLWGSFFSFVLLLPLAYKLVAPSFPFKFHASLAKTLLLFGFPFLFNDLARWSYSWLDRFWLEQLGTLEQVGLYGMAFKIATPLIFLITAFSLAWTPYALKESGDKNTFIQQSLIYWLAFLAICATGISLFSGEVLHLLTPPSFWGAAPLVSPIALGLVFLGSTQVTQIVLMHENKTKKIPFLAWVAGGVNCMVNFILIPLLGAKGAAYSCCLTYVFIGIGTFFWVRNTIHNHLLIFFCICIACLGCCGEFFLKSIFEKGVFLTLIILTTFFVLNIKKLYGPPLQYRIDNG